MAARQHIQDTENERFFICIIKDEKKCDSMHCFRGGCDTAGGKLCENLCNGGERREKQNRVKDWEDFEPEEEKLLYELMHKETGSEFVFVTHYPSSKRPFYAMDSKGNGEVTESFDLLFRGIEITTGGQRIHTYDKQVAKMNARGMHVEVFESYLMMHKYGMPPHGGLGLGLERFTSKLLGYDNVRYATLFPRDINRLLP